MDGRSDYEAAREGVTLAPSGGRRFVEVTGKAAGEMLKGILTGSVPGPLVERSSDATGVVEGGSGLNVLVGKVVYSALLTPKGRMITDLRLFSTTEGGFLMEFPEAGAEGAMLHFGKFLPPRLARAEDVTSGWALVTLVGAEAVALLGQVVTGPGEVEALRARTHGLAEGDELVLLHSPFGPLRITPNGDVHPPAWDLLLSRDEEEGLRTRLAEGGARPLTPDTLEVLRLERGRPAFGKDMDTDTIPVEAGIHTRAIDYEKGCYTGQEVIIRIRDRGQVNKQLRGIQLGEIPVPERGEELYAEGRERPVGWITSACESPAFGETVALGYLRRGVEPGDEVRVGALDGPQGRVRALGEEGWVLPA